MTKKICFHCNKEIVDPLDYNMYPIEIPYLNLFFHKDCFRRLGGYGKMAAYCSERREMVYNYWKLINKGEKISKNGRKQEETVKSTAS